MELIIKKKEAKPLVEREEIKAVIKSDVTPPYDQVKEALASKLNKPAELIVVKNVYSEFGKRESDVRAFVYNSIDALKKFEPKPKAKKEKAKPEEGAGEKAEGKAEGKAEEKVKEKKEESIKKGKE